MSSSVHERSQLSANKADISDMQFFQSSTHIRASTAPSRPLTQLQQFKRSKQFSQLEQTVVCSNQLIHKSFEKFQLEEEGQEICLKYFQHLQTMCKVYNVPTGDRSYRAKFSQAYKVLYKDGQLSYLTQILDSAQQGFPCLYVNQQKYPFSQEVLDYGNKLMLQFFKLEHCLRDLYGKITQQPASININLIITQIKDNLLEFDNSWSTYERVYVMQLMEIQIKARNPIAKAIQAEKCLTSIQIRQKMKGKILLNSQDYMTLRSKLCQIFSQINNIVNRANNKPRLDLDHSILCETEGILRRITRQQSKAVRILAQKIRSSFSALRTLLRKYDNNIQMVDPQLKYNSDLVQALQQYEKAWQKGAIYFCDITKKKYLLHFSGAVQGMAQKYPSFRQMIQNFQADIFLIVPCLLLLKSVDKDDKNICKYFLPDLDQVGTKTFRTYFDLQKLFEAWKKSNTEHYHYYNVLEKLIVGIELNNSQKLKYDQQKQIVDKILSKIKNLGTEVHRYNPIQWNSFMEVCVAGVAQ